MEGEIITNAEMREANDHYDTIEKVIAANPLLGTQLEPISRYLCGLAWKGEGR